MSFARRSRPIDRKAPLRASGLPKRERNRRLASLGLSFRDDDATQVAALAIVERFLDFTRKSASAVSGLRPGGHYWHDDQEWLVGRIDPAHLTTRGSFGPDIGNVLPLTDHEHRLSHSDPEFWSKRGLNPQILAKTHALVFLRAYPFDAAWLHEYAQDGDVVALAAECVARLA